MVKLTDTAMTVLNKRYFINGETKWTELTHRSAVQFGKTKEEVEIFEGLMNNLDFLLNSPALMNAGTKITSYSACYVLQIEDSIESIYKYYKDAALISKSGGGVGANFSNIRGTNSIVNSTEGVASGPISFMEIQDKSTKVIKQGGKRRGANMGILNCDHPDFNDFIHAKEVDGVLSNFNLSVGLTDSFMDIVLDKYELNIETNEDKQWTIIVQKAWEGAEPGILFMDNINRGNLTPHLGEIESTNPCGEQPLLPNESCTLGSINLSNMVTKSFPDFPDFDDETVGINWGKLKTTVHHAVLYLNRVLDNSIFPIPECQEAMEKTRKIGLGIMGLHDMLIQLGIAYGSQEGRDFASEVMDFISKEADIKSTEMGKKEGLYGAWVEGCPKRRNANLTTIAPTGTLSMIADCSGGSEPYFSSIVTKNVMDGEKFVMVNKWFEKAIYDYFPNKEDAFSVMEAVKKNGTINLGVVPDHIQKLFAGAQDISPIDHVLMQAALQKHVDSSISKTINMSNEATIEEVREVLELAYTTGCKGVTVYRDGCRENQVLTTNKKIEKALENPDEIEWNQPVKLDLPDVLSAKRYRIRDKEGNKSYLIICYDEDKCPMEIFHKQPFVQNDILWNTICRSVSLSLRFGIPTIEIIKQLEKSSGSLNDLPAQLAKILKTYLSEETDDGFIEKCTEPNCPGDMIFQGGCSNCDTCGYTKCT